MAFMLLALLTTKAQEITLAPSDDMTVNSGSSGMFPPDDQLWIATWSPMQNYHQVYIKFDLSEYEGQTLKYATLNLNQFFHAPDGSPTPSNIFAIAENWSESTWPSNTNITYGEESYANPEFTEKLGWYEIDITDLVNEWLSGERENYGFALIANSGTKFAEFYSKEATDESLRPFLAFETTSGVGTFDAGQANISCNIYPNPAINQNTNICISAAIAQTVYITLNDMHGKTISYFNSAINAGQSKIELPIENLQAGIYFVRIETPHGFLNKKLVIN